jgi:hypothetical protein
MSLVGSILIVIAGRNTNKCAPVSRNIAQKI